MKKATTTEDFIDAIANEIKWRKRELSNYRMFVCDQSKPRYLREALHRSGITILYAHWEGFVKQACTLYLQHVSMQGLKNKELSHNLQVLLFYGKIKQHDTSKCVSLYSGAVEFLQTQGENRSFVPYKSIIKTYSNLNSAVFREIAWLTQMDYSLFATSENFIDSVLLSKRNHIAHGEVCPIDKGTYLEVHEKVLELIHLVQNQLENNAVMKCYRAS